VKNTSDLLLLEKLSLLIRYDKIKSSLGERQAEAVRQSVCQLQFVSFRLLITGLKLFIMFCYKFYIARFVWPHLYCFCDTTHNCRHNRTWISIFIFRSDQWEIGTFSRDISLQSHKMERCEMIRSPLERISRPTGPMTLIQSVSLATCQAW